MAKAATPHTMPNKKDPMVPFAIRNDNPIPNVVKSTELPMIVLVDGKATRLIML